MSNKPLILLHVSGMNNESEPDQFMDTNDDNYETIDLTNDGGDPMVAELAKDLELYYRIVDEPLATENAMNNEKILGMVYRTFDPEPVATDSEEDEVPLTPLVNLSEAINALQLLIQFQKQRESDDEFKPEELNMLHKKCIILKN
ncbi:3854_t:CDS:2 [Dentiscutata erythropus]|uniref:3854_t:CDS:1 n=1 Tax=Dentiscutata erythropus TaxID=1348616 RepID=A0A9N9D739_9GLOM|nr:3854_t:CDS:2 [Dentiscutata erythropus]